MTKILIATFTAVILQTTLSLAQNAQPPGTEGKAGGADAQGKEAGLTCNGCEVGLSQKNRNDTPKAHYLHAKSENVVAPGKGKDAEK